MIPLHNFPFRHRLIAFACCAVGATALGQTTAAPKVETAIQLETFAVKSARDFGYRATNSITATGIGTEIYRTPISVSVVTRDLMQDIGGSGLLREVLQYTAGVTTDSRDPNQFTTRGFLAPVLVNRVGGGVRNLTSDFVERVEIVKGPNSVFFGRVAPGGVINLITLRPGLTQETKVKLVGGSYNYGRAVIDHNQPITKDLSVRVAGSFLNRPDGYYDWSHFRQNAGYAALTWRLTDTLVLNLTADYADGLQNQPHSGARSDWEYLANPANAAVPIATWGATYRTPFRQPTFTTFADRVAYNDGDKGNNSGPDNFKKDRAKNFQAELTGKPAEWLSFRLVAARRDAVTQTLEVGGFPGPTGTFLAARPTFNGQHPQSDIFEAELVAEFNAAGINHRWLVGARDVANKDETFSIAGLLTNWNNKTDGVRHLTTQFATPWPVAPTTYNRPRGTERALYTAYQASIFSDKVKALLGLRATEVRNRANPGLPTLKSKDTTPQIGLLWEPIKDFSVFANYSKTFEPQFSVDVYGNVAPNVQGEGKEFGFKSNYLDGRLSGTVSVFEVLREGEARRDFLKEIALGVSPIYIAGGASRTRGSELELTFTPGRNYQILFAYSYLWESEVIKDTASPILVGRRLAMSPEHTFALWQRYTFTQGALKNLTVGGGVRHQSNISATLQPIFGLKLENATPVDLLLAYDAKAFGRLVKYQLNLKNVLDERYHDSSSLIADPFTVYLSAELKF